MKKFKKIYIEITNICNLNCPFCNKDEKDKKEMSLSEFEHILKQINNYTDYLYLHVKGEPLLHKKLKDILELCKKYNKQVNLTTNATLLKRRLNDILNSKIVRQVNISLQSLINLDYIDDIIDCADIMSANGIQVVYRMWVENKYQDHLLEIIEKHYNKKIEKDNTKLKENLYFNKDEEFIWPSLNNKVFNESGTCYGTRTHIGILVDGTVIPCCLDSSGIINLGNIFETNLSEIITNERFINMKTNFQNNKLCEELCKKCGFIAKRQVKICLKKN